MAYTFDQRKRGILLLERLGLAKIEQVVAIFKWGIATMWRYWSAYRSGGFDGLQAKSSRPHTNPREHTESEYEAIVGLLSLYQGLGIMELLGQLQLRFGYRRDYYTLRAYIRRNNLQGGNPPRKYHILKEYHTPQMLGLKWQMDVKYVPPVCRKGMAVLSKYYQYTIIDEATRERFIYAYLRQNAESTEDFMQRAIAYFGYRPMQIQTDNGGEFTNRKKGKLDSKKPHKVALKCEELKIIHKLIPPATPRLDGKVERSHLNDQKWFYDNLTFESFDELQNKMAAHLYLSNNAVSKVLQDEQGKWISSIKMRAIMIERLKAKMCELDYTAEMELQDMIYIYAKWERDTGQDFWRQFKSHNPCD
jgi:transposase InsO family protein